MPTSPSWLDDFRAAVVQHAIAISVRRYKNIQGLTQDSLGRLDGRADATNKWNARLNGRIGLTLRDIALIVRILPGAMPSEAWVQQFLQVAEYKAPPPPGWHEIDA